MAETCGSHGIRFAVAMLVLSCTTAVRAQSIAWELRSSSGPGARYAEMMIYDQPRDRVVLFGGYYSNSDGTGVVNYQDTWAFSLGTSTWSQISTTGTAPPGGATGAAIYDATRQRMVVVGSDKLAYSLPLTGAATWTQLTTTPVSNLLPGRSNSAAYDPPRDQMWVAAQIGLGGGAYRFNLATNAWTATAHAYTAFPDWAKLVYDPVNQRIIAVGGWDAPTGGGNCAAPSGFEVWSLPAATPDAAWTGLTTNPPWTTRANFGLAYDSNHQRLLLSCGVSDFGSSASGCIYCTGPFPCHVTNSPRNSVYAMDVTTNQWTTLSPSGTPPSQRGFISLVYDPVRDQSIQFGGGFQTGTPPANFCSGFPPVCTWTDSHTYFGDTWALHYLDQTPPAQTTNLGASMFTNGASLSWTAPGDDGNQGTVASYIVKYSPTPLTSVNFDSEGNAISPPTPLPAGSLQGACVDVLDPGTAYWFALRSYDESGNASPVSNIVNKSTKTIGPSILCDNGVRIDLEGGPAKLTVTSHPNPAVDAVHVNLAIPTQEQGRPIDATLFDLLGRRIKTLATGTVSQEAMRFDWDRRDDAGQRVRPGIYMLRVRAGSSLVTRVIQLN
jgi:hypothetical protein